MANIRSANKEDCARLMELINELALHQGNLKKVDVSMEEFEDSGFGNDPVWKAFVAEINGLVVGFALYYIRYSTWNGRKLYLEDFMITAEMRRKSIGKLLFNRLITEANRLGMNGITWQILDWNTPAIKFYKRYYAEITYGVLNASLSKEQQTKFQSQLVN